MNDNYAIKLKFLLKFNKLIYIYLYLYSENNLIKQFKMNLNNDFYHAIRIVKEIKFTAVHKLMIVKIDY